MNVIDRLIQEAHKHCWQPIEFAPKDKVFLGVIEYKPGKFGEPFIAEWVDGDGYICKEQTEIAPHRPTHSRHLDTPQSDIVAKLLEVVKVAVPALEYAALRLKSADRLGVSETDGVVKALARINAILEGKSS